MKSCGRQEGRKVVLVAKSDMSCGDENLVRDYTEGCNCSTNFIPF